MRIFLVLSLFALSLTARAAQIDIAVIQFPETKTAAELDAALANVDLAEMTNSDRTMTKEPYLKGGYVVFAQSLPFASRFASSTRLSNNRAEVSGSAAGGRLSVSITLSEGVDAGLRRFSSRSYEGSGPLAAGQTRVLSLRQISGRTQVVVKGQPTLKETSLCSAVIARISK